MKKHRILVIILTILLILLLVIARTYKLHFSPGAHFLFGFGHLEYSTRCYLFSWPSGEYIGESVFTIDGNLDPICDDFSGYMEIADYPVPMVCEYGYPNPYSCDPDDCFFSYGAFPFAELDLAYPYKTWVYMVHLFPEDPYHPITCIQTPSEKFIYAVCANTADDAFAAFEEYSNCTPYMP